MNAQVAFILGIIAGTILCKITDPAIDYLLALPYKPGIDRACKDVQEKLDADYGKGKHKATVKFDKMSKKFVIMLEEVN